MKTIMRKIVVPEWACWIAQNCIGDWYAYEFPPVTDYDGGWNSPDGKEERLFEGPIKKPWQKTLQRI